MTTRDAYIAAENGEEVPVYNEDDRRPEVGALVREMRAQVTTGRAISGILGEPQPAFQPVVILINDDEDDEDDYEDEDDDWQYDDDEDEDEELNFEVYGDGGNGWVDEI
jgi:hypothetical protein